MTDARYPSVRTFYAREDLNLRPSHPQCDALSPELRAHQYGGTGIRTPKPIRAYRFSRPAPCHSVIPPSRMLDGQHKNCNHAESVTGTRPDGDRTGGRTGGAGVIGDGEGDDISPRFLIRVRYAHATSGGPVAKVPVVARNVTIRGA